MPAEEEAVVRGEFRDNMSRPLGEVERQMKATGRAADEMGIEAAAAGAAMEAAAAKSGKLKSELRELENQMDRQKVASLKLSAAESELQRLRAQGPLTLKDTARAEGAVTNARIGLENATRRVTASHKELDTAMSKLSASALRNVVSMTLLKRAMQGLQFVGMVQFLGLIAGGISSLGAAGIAAVAGLAPLVGLLGGLPALALSMISLGIVTKVVTGAIGNLAKVMMQTQVNSQQLNAALMAIGPGGLQLYTALKPVTDQLKQMRSAILLAALPGLQSAFQSITPLLPVIQEGLTGLANVLGNIAANASAMMASGPWQADTQTIMKRSNTLFQSAGEFLMAMADGFRQILIAAGPMNQMLADSATNAMKSTDAWLANARASGKLEAFFTRTGQLAIGVGRVLRDFFIGLANLFRGAAPLSDSMGDSIGKAAAHFREWTGSTDGQARIMRFFTEAKPLVYAIANLFGDLAKEMGKFASGSNASSLTNFVNVLDKMLPLLTQVLTLILKIGALPGVSDVTGPLAAYALMTRFLPGGKLLGKGITGIGRFGGGLLGSGGAKTAEGGAAKLGEKAGLKVFGAAGARGAMMGGADAIGGAAAGVVPLLAAVPVIGWIILAVAALVALGVVLYMKWKPFRDLVNDIGRFFKAAFMWVKDHAKIIAMGALAVFLPFIGIPLLMITHWHQMADVVKNVWGAISGWIHDAIDWVVDKLKDIVKWFGNVVNSIPGVGIAKDVGGWFAHPHLAEGGPTTPGVTYLTGEVGPEALFEGGKMRLLGTNGPEFLQAKQSGFVLPADETSKLMSMVGKGDRTRVSSRVMSGAGGPAQMEDGFDLPDVIVNIGSVRSEMDIEKIKRGVRDGIERARKDRKSRGGRLN